MDFALLCASHRDLRAEVEAGRFREDLYYRIAGQTLTLPPLRERSDFEALVVAMLARMQPGARLAPEALAVLRRQAWPGNLRELEHLLRGAVALLDPGQLEIGFENLPPELDRPAKPLAPGLRAQARQTVTEVLRDCGGNRTEAARRLGLSRSTLYRQLAR